MSTALSTTEAEQRVASRITQEGARGVAIVSGSGLVMENMEQALEFAKMMAVGGVAVPKHLRGQPGACMAVIIQALEWRKSPYAVANKSYSVNDRLAYEAQLLAAVVIENAPLDGLPTYSYSGDAGTTRKCIVTVKLRNGQVIEHSSPEVGKITPKNSPLWKSDEDQQLGYYTVRAMARRNFPHILLGASDPDDAAGAAQYDAPQTRDITPARQTTTEKLDQLAGPAPTAAQQDEAAREGADPVTGEIIDPEKPKPRGRRAAPKADAAQPSTAESQQQDVAAAVAHPTVQAALDAFPGAAVRDVRQLETKGQNDAAADPWEPEAVDDNSDPFADIEEDDDEQVDPEVERIQIRMAELDHAPRGIDPDDISQCRQYLAGIDAASKGMPLSAIPNDLRVDERKVEGRAWMAGHDSVTGSSPAARKAAKEARAGAAQRQ